MKKLILSFVIAFAVINASAHVNLNNPVGGETYDPGDTVAIKWQIAIAHALLNWDLFWSSNGGSTWDTIQIDIPFTGTTVGTIDTFYWVVPNTPTSQAQIWIYMDNAGTDYDDKSLNFTINSLIGIEENKAVAPPTIYPNPFSERTVLYFENNKGQPHNLTIHNINGDIVKRFENLTTDHVAIARESLPSGLYFYHLHTSGTLVDTGRMIE